MKLVEGLDVYKEIDKYHPTVQRVLDISLDIAREGFEGAPHGTMFVIGDEKRVLARSQPLILDLFDRQKIKDRSIHNTNTRETIKRLSVLDGAFILTGDGIVVSAARYLNPEKFCKVPMGVGTRHVTGASITAETDSVAIIVSASGSIRIYAKGVLVREYKVELKLSTIDGKISEKAELRSGSIKKGVPVFKSDDDHYLYQEHYIYNETNGVETGKKGKVCSQNSTVTFTYENNNSSVDYSFVSELKMLTDFKYLNKKISN
jgi:hypothetical protein